MIPATAVERLRRLQDWAEEARVAYLAAHESITDLRDQLGKAELNLQRHSRGHRLQVQADGSVVIVGHRPPPRDLGDGNMEILPPATAPFAATAAAQREVREIGRMRERLGRLQPRSAELAARTATFGELARAAEELLNDRGWSDGQVPDLIGASGPKAARPSGGAA